MYRRLENRAGALYEQVSGVGVLVGVAAPGTAVAVEVAVGIAVGVQTITMILIGVDVPDVPDVPDVAARVATVVATVVVLPLPLSRSKSSLSLPLPLPLPIEVSTGRRLLIAAHGTGVAVGAGPAATGRVAITSGTPAAACARIKSVPRCRSNRDGSVICRRTARTMIAPTSLPLPPTSCSFTMTIPTP